MTQTLSPEQFFDLSEFPHPGLFLNSVYAWDALKNIWAYLNTFEYEPFDAESFPGVYFENIHQISLGANVSIEPGAYIKGPCIVGDYCEIRNGAYLRSNVVLGKNCVIGHATEIVRSIVLNHAKAAHFNYVGDSIIGNRANLGAGFVCANLKHNESEVLIKDGKRKISTSLNKLGAIVGDAAKLGCNGVSNPGTLFEKNAKTMPCTSLHGIIS